MHMCCIGRVHKGMRRNNHAMRGFGAQLVLLFAATFLAWRPATAQDIPGDPSADYGEIQDPDNQAASPRQLPDAPITNDDFWSRPTVTGDWLGFRTTLQEAGVTFAVRETQFAFGIAGGVNQPVAPPLGEGDTFQYTGRGEYDTILDLEKVAGLPNGKFLMRFENWYGEYGNVSLRAGTFAPPVFPALLPPALNGQGIPYLTNFLWTQPLSKNLVLFAGKKDVLGSIDQDAFAGGDGTDRFVNQAFIANPAFLLGLPYTSFTAGFVSPQEWGGFGGYVFDATDRTTNYLDLKDLFERGIIVGGEVKLKTNFFDRPGQHHVGGVWKHLPLTNLAFQEPPPGVYPEPTVPGFPTIPNSYTVYYGFDQFLVRYSNSQRGWGAFGRASISDGNPTPVQYFLSCGLGGATPFSQESKDTFGIGWYLVGASQQFGPLPRAIFGPRNGTGVELFYNFQVTPFLNITPDIQFIRPGAGAIAENSFVYGVRLNANF